MIADTWILNIAVIAALALGVSWVFSNFISRETFESIFVWVIMGVIFLAIGTCAG